MENNQSLIRPHQDLEHILFADKRKVSLIFSDVLGIYDLDHISIGLLDTSNHLLTFSSTPALEFNLFHKKLWRYDQTYYFSWVTKGIYETWQNLYESEYFDELYYNKQVKHNLPIAYSMAGKIGTRHAIYSIGTKKNTQKSRDFFMSESALFYKMGLYCAQSLKSLFIQYDESLEAYL